MYEHQFTQAPVLPAVCTGTVVEVSPDGRPVVEIPGEGRHTAMTVWMRDQPGWSECTGSRVAVGFMEDDQGRHALVLGLLDPPKVNPAPRPEVLKFESTRELVIECGKSKIAMRADGRIEIRGGHLVSRSSGPNKIKGGSVHIN